MTGLQNHISTKTLKNELMELSDQSKHYIFESVSKQSFLTAAMLLAGNDIVISNHSLGETLSVVEDLIKMSFIVPDLESRIKSADSKIKKYQSHLHLKNVGTYEFSGTTLQETHVFMRKHSYARGWLPIEFQIEAAKACGSSI